MATTTKRGVTAAAAILGILLSGCGVSADDEPAPDAASTAPSPTADAEPTPEETPESSPSAEPTDEASTPAAEPGSPEAALLAAADLPQVNEQSTWTEKRTTVPGQTSFGLCQQFDTLSIGAMSVVERTFTTGSSGRDTAGQQVAEFPDSQNTVRASKVLETWHDECRDEVRGRNVKVRAIEEVPVAAGRGWWYLVSYTRGGTGRFHSFGVTWQGSRMTLLRMDHDGQDHNYEPGQDPMELAVKAASAKMG